MKIISVGTHSDAVERPGKMRMGSHGQDSWTVRVKTDFGTLEVDVMQRIMRNHTTKEYLAKTRVYVSDSALIGNEKLQELQRQEAALGDKRYAQRGTDTDVDKLYDRLNRAIGTESKRVARLVLAAIAEDVDVRFSKHAGCTMCPCSPGVTVDARLTLGGKPVNIWVRAVQATKEG